MDNFGVPLETQPTQAIMEGELNSWNSTHVLDEQPRSPAQHEADQNNTFIPNGPHGSNPSVEPRSNPSQIA